MKLTEFLNLDIIDDEDCKNIWLEVKNAEGETETSVDLSDIKWKGFSKEVTAELTEGMYDELIQKYGNREIIRVAPMCSMTMDAMFLIIVK